MKLNCPKCNLSLARENINFDEGIGYCASCEEFFRIADYLQEDETIQRTEKPLLSKIGYQASNEEHEFFIPKTGWNGIGLFLLFFALIWNGISWTAFLSDGMQSLFLIPFCLIGIIVSLVMIYTVYARHYIRIKNAELELETRVLGFSFRKKRKLQNLDKVYKVEMYTQNNQPVFGVGVSFIGQGDIKFGSSLTDSERTWLIGEIGAIHQEWENREHKGVFAG